MDFHPYAERFPLMAGEDYERFRADIAANGVRFPIMYRMIADGQRQGLDGRNRSKATQELGLACPEVLVRVDDASVEGFINSCNLYRRHMDAASRAALVLAMRQAGLSQRTIAASLGVGRSTVQRDLSTPPANPPEPAPENPRGPNGPPQSYSASINTNEPPPFDDEPPSQHYAPPSIPPVIKSEPEKVRGRDGKTYPPTRPAKTSKEGNRQQPNRVPPPEPEDDEVVDEAGYIVGGALRGIFATREAIRSTRIQMERIVNKMKEVEGSDAYRLTFGDRASKRTWTQFQIDMLAKQGLTPADIDRKGNISVTISTAAYRLRQCEPHSIHQNCPGTGCQVCDGKGWLSEQEAAIVAEEGAHA